MITFKLFLSLFVVVVFAKAIFVRGKSNTFDDVAKRRNTRLRRGSSNYRITGGSRARITKWPWQVLISLYHPNVWETYVNGQGGGSLINNEWVLTAAHIFDNINKISNWEHGIVLTFGLQRLPRSNHRLSSQVQVFKADHIILHSNYSSTTYDYDVALIKVGSELKERDRYWVKNGYTGWVLYTIKVQPVRLPCMERSCTRKHLKRIGLLRNNHTEEESCSIEGDWLLEKHTKNQKSLVTVVTGFGTTTTHRNGFQQEMSKVLKKGQIRLNSDARCNRTTDEIINAFPSKHVAKFTNRMICGIGGDSRNAIDACLRDDGGPLVRKATKRCWVQIGIVSWDFGCGQNYKINGFVKQRPGYYTNVIALLPWIIHASLVPHITPSKHGAEACNHPVGLKDRRILSHQITASSIRNRYNQPEHARLDEQYDYNGYNSGSWLPYSITIGEWIQVDFETAIEVVAIITQGHPFYRRGITRFKISYGTSVDQLQVIRDNNGDDVIFQATPNRERKTRNNFPQPVPARYIRLIIQEWLIIPELRMEYITC